jgi:uncharacterized protein YkwD
MKNLLRILIVATFLGIILYYTSVEEEVSEPLRGPNSPTQAIPRTEVEELSMYLPRPLEGVSTYVGKGVDLVLQQFGAPTRIDQSGFQYDWWIYLKDYEFIMFSVQDDIVTQVYTTSSQHNVAPYSIGQSLEEIYRMTIVESEIAVTIDDTIYMFLMDEKDLKTRLLVAFEDVFAQLYFDQVTNKLIGVRFIDGETLVRHKPYEFQYIGEMIQHTVPSSFKQSAIDQSYANQIYNLVNEFRLLNNLPKVLRSPILNEVAMEHSEYIALKDLNTSSEESKLTLDMRLKEKDVEFKKMGGNVAVNYYDAIEVIHGWMNSKEHRNTLFNEKYNISGIGVYLNNYTQVFIEEETPF